MFSDRGHEFRAKLIWIELFLSGCLLGSLAWAGHGQEGQPAGLHLLADVLHLLVAGIWPAGLLPFFLLLRKMRQKSESTGWQSIALLVESFFRFQPRQRRFVGDGPDSSTVGSWLVRIAQPVSTSLWSISAAQDYPVWRGGWHWSDEPPSFETAPRGRYLARRARVQVDMRLNCNSMFK